MVLQDNVDYVRRVLMHQLEPELAKPQDVENRSEHLAKFLEHKGISFDYRLFGVTDLIALLDAYEQFDG